MLCANHSESIVMKPNIYENTAQFYDIGCRSELTKDDIPFYLSFFKRGQTVLDIGCGTGRIGLELAKAGVLVSGIDLSQSMLRIYRGKISPDLQPFINLYNCDMTDFNLSHTFDGIIFPFHSFQALLTASMRISCLSCVKSHLHDQSIAIIALSSPDPQTLRQWGNQNIVNLDIALPHEQCNLRRIINQVHHDRESQVLTQEIVIQKHIQGKITEEFTDRMELAYLTIDQARHLFSEQGFRIEAEYGYYDFRPINGNHPKELIFVLRK